ncbi:C40 family peptidase [Klenkia sp. PcliD-1-E]|jgi:cell wall-associated NlpC family hydrolase|uniref:C40 family peptidase n=1 Tax=Klenkia sp. PcliD-1-E TaxID=2954492 RepID=UPI00273A74D1|nr:C40 family peptidase [Klenkia sp. PcliD-1-E]
MSLGWVQAAARVAEIRATLNAVAGRPAPTAETTTGAQWSAAAAAAGLPTGNPAPPTAGATRSTNRPTGAEVSTAAGAGVDQTGVVPGAPGGQPSVVDVARRYLGVPYLWGGDDPAVGLDCSGFTSLVFAQLGVTVPRTSAQQATAGRAVPDLSTAQPGDLLFFDYSPDRPGIDHVGIYIGGNQMIAAPQPGEVVKVQAAGSPTVIRRVLTEG